jgi:hypothetical protein
VLRFAGRLGEFPGPRDRDDSPVIVCLVRLAECAKPLVQARNLLREHLVSSGEPRDRDYLKLELHDLNPPLRGHRRLVSRVDDRAAPEETYEDRKQHLHHVVDRLT